VNFPINIGDTVDCVICTTGSGATEASIFFSNLSTGLSTSFKITAPANTKLVGNSAEWIVETPTVNGSLATLADYGFVFFPRGSAYDGVNIRLPGTGNDVDMLDANGTMISDGVLDSPQLVHCVYTG
jgi:hypothetical protein